MRIPGYLFDDIFGLKSTALYSNKTHPLNLTLPHIEHIDSDNTHYLKLSMDMGHKLGTTLRREDDEDHIDFFLFINHIWQKAEWEKEQMPRMTARPMTSLLPSFHWDKERNQKSCEHKFQMVLDLKSHNPASLVPLKLNIHQFFIFFG